MFLGERFADLAEEAASDVEKARRLVGERPWGAEIIKLSGSIELAPLLHLAELALDLFVEALTHPVRFR